MSALCIALWKTAWQFFKKLVMVERPYDRAILLVVIYPKELKAGSQRGIYTLIFLIASFTIETQVSADRLMDKQNVVHKYNGILFSL